MLHDRYILWRLVRRAAPERNQKFPVDYRDGSVADAFNPDIWLTLDQARTYATLWGDDVGVAYVLMPDAGEFFIDIDDCLHAGEWSPIAQELVARFAGAFVEVSSSGTGLHIIGRGTLAPGERRCKGAGFDLYTGHRFVALTFDRVQGDPSTDHSPALAALVEQYLQLEGAGVVPAEWVSVPVADYGPERTDDEIIEAALRARSVAGTFGGRATFRDLWEGNAQALGASFPDDHDARPYDASAADFSLASRLMWYCGGNSEQVRRIMERSALARPKWSERPEYLTTRTISRARGAWIGGGSKIYTGGRALAERRPPPEPPPGGPGSMLGQGWDYFHVPWSEVKTTGKPKASYPNFLALIEKAEVAIRYNLMRREIEINIPGASYLPEMRLSDSIGALTSLCNIVEFPTAQLQAFINQAAHESVYHPALEWVRSIPWDGVDRIPALVASLDARTTVVDMMLRKWLHTAVDALVEPDGIAAGGMLVLQGAQYRGKTTWLTNLMGGHGKSESTLNPVDKDSVAQNTSYWIVEISELDGVTTKAEASMLKGFITRSRDEYRAPYATTAVNYARRTIFCGSVNRVDYLVDDTGNRRFWTIECGEGLNAMHGIDVQQIWAQVMAQRTGRARPWTKDELAALNTNNERFEVQRLEPVFDLITARYDLTAARPRVMSVTEILNELVLPIHNAHRVSNQIAKALGVEGSRKSHNGRRVFDMPLPRFTP